MLQTYGPSSPESSFDDETPIEMEAEQVVETTPTPIQGELFFSIALPRFYQCYLFFTEKTDFKQPNLV